MLSNGERILTAARSLHAFGLNVLPLRRKIPVVPGWVTWQTQRIGDPDMFSWNGTTTGLAVVLGFGDVHDIEFDSIRDDETMEQIFFTMEKLLPDAWIYKSGSGEGLHILFRCLGKNPFRNAVTNAGPKTPGQFHHAERMCLTELCQRFRPGKCTINLYRCILLTRRIEGMVVCSVFLSTCAATE